MAQAEQLAHVTRDNFKKLTDHGENAYLHATQRRGYDRQVNVVVGHGTLNIVQRVVSHDRIDHAPWYRERHRAGGSRNVSAMVHAAEYEMLRRWRERRSV